MIITYYQIDDYGFVLERTVDTSEESYVSHTDNSVTVKTSYYNEYMDVLWRNATYPRNFETTRQERIKRYKAEITNLQKLLSVYENCVDYKDYWQLMYKKD